MTRRSLMAGDPGLAPLDMNKLLVDFIPFDLEEPS